MTESPRGPYNTRFRGETKAQKGGVNCLRSQKLVGLESALLSLQSLDAPSGYTSPTLQHEEEETKKKLEETEETGSVRSLGVFTMRLLQRAWGYSLSTSCTTTLAVSAFIISFPGIGFRVRFCLKRDCHCHFVCLFKFGNHGPALVP